MLAPSKHNINLWKMMISSIIINCELLNGNWHRFNGGYDGSDNNIIKISRTKSSKWHNKILSPFICNLNQGCFDTWLLHVTISELIACLSARTIQGMAQFSYRSTRETRASLKLSTNKRTNLSIPLKGMCISTPIAFPSLWRWEVHQALFPIG